MRCEARYSLFLRKAAPSASRSVAAQSWLIWCLLLMIGCVALPLQGQTSTATATFVGSFSSENDTDRPGLGSDYSNFDLSEASPLPCQLACLNDARCRAFTYVKPGVQGPNARCWLKSSVPAARPSTCCISGVKQMAGSSAPFD